MRTSASREHDGPAGPPRSGSSASITSPIPSNNGAEIVRRVKAVEAHGLVKRYGSVTALAGVDLDVEAGDFFGLFGPNGAGKTTLLRILTGQLAPTAGRSSVLGIDPAREPLKVKAAIGIVPEVESPPSYLTASEYLYFVGRVRDVPRLQEAIDRWIAFFDLDEARGPIYRRKLKDYLQQYRDAGGTVFMCSNLLEIAEKLCDRVAVIDGGRVIAKGSVAEVKRDERDLEAAFLRLVGERR